MQSELLAEEIQSADGVVLSPAARCLSPLRRLDIEGRRRSMHVNHPMPTAMLTNFIGGVRAPGRPRNGV